MSNIIFLLLKTVTTQGATTRGDGSSVL